MDLLIKFVAQTFESVFEILCRDRLNKTPLQNFCIVQVTS